MSVLGAIGIIIALALIIYLACKGFNILIIGPLCSIIVILTNGMDLMTYLFTDPTYSFMWSCAGFIAKYLPVFLLGSILGKYMEDSGAAYVIAKRIMRNSNNSGKSNKQNAWKVMLAITLVGAILSYGGVNAFVVLFTVVSLSRPLFKEADLPWHLIVIPVGLGAASFTMTLLPGAPSVHNMIATLAMGTPLTSGALLGIFTSVVFIAFSLWYMRWQLNKCYANDEHYEESAAEKAMVERENLPSLGLSLLPLIVVVAILLPGSFLQVDNIVYIGLPIGIVLSVIIYHKYLDSQIKTLNAGALNALTPAVFTGAAVGFGMVIIAAPVFQKVVEAMLSIGNPLASLTVLTFVFSGVTGSPSGALGIILNTYAQHYIDLGLTPEVIHRMALVAATPMAAIPFGGGVFNLFAVCGVTHKQSYRHLFWTTIVGGILVVVLGLIFAMLVY